MPELEHDHLALVTREMAQCGHGGTLDRALARVALEPANGLELPRDAAPKAAAMVQRVVPERSDKVEFRLAGRRLQVKQRAKSVVKDVLGLGVTEAEGSSVHDDFGGAGIVELRRPVRFVVNVGFHRTQ